MHGFTSAYQQALEQLTAPGAPFEVTRVDQAAGSVAAFKNAAPSLRDYLNGGRSSTPGRNGVTRPFFTPSIA